MLLLSEPVFSHDLEINHTVPFGKELNSKSCVEGQVSIFPAFREQLSHYTHGQGQQQ
jgi:hypothetical protein